MRRQGPVGGRWTEDGRRSLIPSMSRRYQYRIQRQLILPSPWPLTGSGPGPETSFSFQQTDPRSNSWGIAVYTWEEVDQVDTARLKLT
jgi:hypothetical protein